MSQVEEHSGLDDTRIEGELIGRAERLRDAARAAGADQAEVYAVRAETIAVRFEQGDLKLAQVDDASTLGVRVMKDRRLGFAATNQAAEEALEQAARDALRLAAQNPPDDANRLPETQPPAPRLALIDPELAELGIERVVELGQTYLERALAHDDRLAVENASLERQHITHALVNTEGATLAESDVVVGSSIFGMAVEGDDVGGFHYTGEHVRRAERLASSLETGADEFARVALGNLGAAASKSYRGPVLFSPDAVLDLFVSPILGAAGAIAVQRGRSALAGKLGEAIASPAFRLLDDPTDLGLAGAGSFDREGTPIGPFPIVEDGVLRSFLYNGYAAAVEGRASTGHAVGGARSVPGLGAHATSLAGGTGGDAAAMQERLGEGLYVMRFSGTVDPASGDFSGVAKSARWIEGGRSVRPVRETLISGNTFELLHRILALSTETPAVHGSARAPWALVDDVSVTAG